MKTVLLLDPDQHFQNLKNYHKFVCLRYSFTWLFYFKHIWCYFKKHSNNFQRETDFHRARGAFVLIKINIYCRQARQGMRLGALSSDFSLWFCVNTRYYNNYILFSASTNILIHWIVSRTCRMRAFLRGHDGSDHQILSKLTTVGCEGCDLVIKVRGEFLCCIYMSIIIRSILSYHVEYAGMQFNVKILWENGSNYM